MWDEELTQKAEMWAKQNKLRYNPDRNLHELYFCYHTVTCCPCHRPRNTIIKTIIK